MRKMDIEEKESKQECKLNDYTKNKLDGMHKC